MQTNIVEEVIIDILFNNGREASLSQLISAIDAIYCETKDLDLGQPAREKYVDAIVFDITADAEVDFLQVEIGTRDRLEDDIVWTSPFKLTLDNPIVDPRLTAKFYTLKISDTQPNNKLSIHRIEFYGRVVGGRIER